MIRPALRRKLAVLPKEIKYPTTIIKEQVLDEIKESLYRWRGLSYEDIFTLIAPVTFII